MATLLQRWQGARASARTVGTEVYDPATGTWTALAVPTRGRLHPAALLSDGTVLMAADGPTGCTAAALYDPRTGSLTTTSSMLRCADDALLVHAPARRHGPRGRWQRL